MGIPGMLTFLRDRGTIKKREFRHMNSAKEAGEGPNADQPIGPGLVFDSFALIELLLQEWAKLPRAHPFRFDHTRGGQVTQLRAFYGHYVKQLVEDYQCTVTWVRDAGVNRKPAMIPQDVFDFVRNTCPLTDHVIRSGQTDCPHDPSTRTVDIVSELYLLEKREEDFLLGAVEDVRLGSSLLVIDAPVNRADAEVWRQAQRMAATRETFIVSVDTDMFFFADTSPSNVGIVLLYQQTYESYLPRSKVEAVGDQWSCDLRGNVSSRFLRLKFCYVEDVASECKVDAKYLPVLGACLGGDLGKHDGNYHEFTVRLKAALLQRHFKNPAVVAAFRQSEEGLQQQLKAVAKARMKRLLGNQTCNRGEFCRWASCERIHPAKGNLRCKYEEPREGRCPNPCCRMRHSRPIGFRVAASTVDRFEGHESLKSTVFDTWEQAVQAASNMVNKWKQASHGIGPHMTPGAGLSFYDHFWSRILRLTCELVETHSKKWRRTKGEVDMRACARDLCAWLEGVSGYGENGITQALIRAIETYSPLPLDQPLPPVELQTPNLTLEKWCLRKFCRTKPYPLPSDAGIVNWITESLRTRIGRELGITDFVEGVQIGSKYVVKRVVCDEGLQAQSRQSPLTHSTRFRLKTLFEMLGLARETDDDWLKDLETTLQALPGLIFSKTARANNSDFPLSGALRQMPERNAKDDTLASAKSLDEDLDSVVVLKVVILSITLWQRTLTSPHAQVPGHSGQLAHERVEALARWEVRAFVGSTILGWIQLQRKQCPFDLLAGKLETCKDGDVDFLFSSTPANLRRRAFVLTAQFLEVVNDVVNTSAMLCLVQDHLLHGLREVYTSPETIFSLYTAVGRAKPEHERDERVRSKLVNIFNTGNEIISAQFAEACDRLVHHVMDTRPNDLDDLDTADDWEDLDRLPF